MKDKTIYWVHSYYGIGFRWYCDKVKEDEIPNGTKLSKPYYYDREGKDLNCIGIYLKSDSKESARNKGIKLLKKFRDMEYSKTLPKKKIFFLYEKVEAEITPHPNKYFLDSIILFGIFSTYNEARKAKRSLLKKQSGGVACSFNIKRVNLNDLLEFPKNN